MRTFFLLAVLLTLGCSNGSVVVVPADTSSEAKPDTDKAKLAVETNKDDTSAEKAAEPWGTVRGRVTWRDRDLPALAPLIATNDAVHCNSHGPIPNDIWVVNKENKGVRYVVVWLADANVPRKPLLVHPSLKEIKEKQVVVDQPCCRFEPRVVALREGQVLVARNGSPVNHNFNYIGGDDQGNNIVVPAGTERAVADLIASDKVFSVSCGIHSWMKGYVRVFDHPYFAVTDADGNFEIKNAPAGKYNLVIWHEDGGWVTGTKKGKPIEIKPGAVTEVNETTRPAE